MAFTYEVAAADRSGRERVHPYTSDTALGPGDVLRLGGRDWLAVRAQGDLLHVTAARYRLELRHPDGHVEAGAVRRWRSDAPREGHTFSTVEDGQPAGWQVVEQSLATDDEGEPFLALVA